MGASGNDNIEWLRLLTMLVDGVAAALDLQEIYERALDGLKAALSIERCAILLLDEDNVIRFVASRGLSDEYKAKAEGHFPWPVDAIDPPSISVADAMKDPTLISLYEDFRRNDIGSLAFIPLVYDRKLLGKFMLYHPVPHEFTLEELALSQTIARLIAFAVQRRRIENTLRDVDRRKDEFVATLAHELRNPLGALSAALDVMALLDIATTEHAHTIARRQVLHLSRLLDDLLDLSRITRGLVELKKEPVELSAVVARAVEAIRPVLDRMHHELVLAVPARRLLGDPVRLEQIMSNLVGNAAKYTPAGGTITISAANEPEQVVLRVRDNGIGMPASLIPHVFDMFAQGERRLDRSQGGLGIGLSITKQLVERHGGTITAFSAGPGTGSEFVVTLPAPRVMDVESPRMTAVGTGVPNSSGAIVLVVDDNEDLAGLLAHLLRSWGHIVETQTTSQAALDAVQHFVPDVILLDIGLPEIDGYELARRFRAMQQLDATTLIAMSGYGRPSDIRRSYAAGFATHLVKPIDPGLLRKLLARVAMPTDEPPQQHT
jgi:signal transduction histidine kinase/CheY-like chemotaxis protein